MTPEDKNHFYKKENLESRFDLFVRYFFKKETGREFLWNWHLNDICDALTKVYTGETKRLIINIPPRYGKTEIVKMFCAWGFAMEPQSNFIYTSYSDRLVLDCSSSIRTLVKSEAFQEFWDIDISTDTDSKRLWRTNSRGGFYAVSTGGSITGWGAGIMEPGFGGILICDDPIKADDVYSKILREKGIRYYTNTLLSRLNNRETPIVIIMQRLHEEDLTGYVLKEEIGDWTVLKLPVISNDGKPLWEYKHNVDDIVRLKRNRFTFSGQYMQEPSPIEGGVFKAESIQYYEEIPEFDRVVQSWDTAFKKGEENDYSVCTTWGIKPNQFGDYFYLIDLFKGKLEYPELMEKFIELQGVYNPFKVLIEDKASGQSLIQSLGRIGNKNLVPIKVGADKQTRASTASGLIQNTYFPKNASWMPDLLDELLMFPNAAHDDQVDSLVHFLNWTIKPKKEMRIHF